jgi:hypothetical protein
MSDQAGTEDQAHMAFAMVNSLLNLLIRKNVISRADVVTMLGEIADSFSKDTRAIRKKNAGYIRDTLIPEHQSGK